MGIYGNLTVTNSILQKMSQITLACITRYRRLHLPHMGFASLILSKGSLLWCITMQLVNHLPWSHLRTKIKYVMLLRLDAMSSGDTCGKECNHLISSIYPSIYIHLSIYLPTYLASYLSIYLSIYLYPDTHVGTYVFLCMYLYIYIYIYMCLCIYI